MTPITARLLIRLNKANRMTIKPADLKNIPDFGLPLKPERLKLISASTGSVPIANASIVRPPVRKLPVESAYSCID